MPQWSPDAYRQALRFAAEAHHGQKFPGTELPYLLHVCAVAAEVVAALAQEDADLPDLAVQCALLHDTLEDTPTPRARLREAFGEAVADAVSALSKDGTLPKGEQMADSLRRIRLQPREVWLVKLCDRICNLEAPPDYWSREKIASYRAEAAEILRELGPASPYLAERLARKIEAYAGFE